MVLSKPTLEAARALVAKVLENSGAGPIGEAAGDVRVLRTDLTLNGNLLGDLDYSQMALTEAMLSALEQGCVDEMAHQVTAIRGLTFSVTSQDREDMAAYPVQGHTCDEISQYLHDNLRYEVSGMLASPLVGDSQLDSLPQLLGDLSTRFGARCATAVAEAYFAGVQMAIRGIAGAMGV